MNVYNFRFIALEKATGEISIQDGLASSLQEAEESLECRYPHLFFWHFVEISPDVIVPFNSETADHEDVGKVCKGLIEIRRRVSKWQ